MFLFKFIRRAISFILLLIIVIPLYIAGSIWYSARNSEPVKSEVILVMGAAQFDGRPSEVLQSRLDESLKIYKAGLAPRIYTVGSGAPGDRTTEAASGKYWLRMNGIPSRKITAIEEGRDTLVSTKAYAAVMKKRFVSDVIIVTDPYHCKRAMAMANDQGVISTCSPVQSGPNTIANSGYRYLLREAGAYLVYITVGKRGLQISDHLPDADIVTKVLP